MKSRGKSILAGILAEMQDITSQIALVHETVQSKLVKGPSSLHYFCGEVTKNQYLVTPTSRPFLSLLKGHKIFVFCLVQVLENDLSGFFLGI